MEREAPDLIPNVNAHAATAAEKSKRDDDFRSDEAELEQLADRVVAARSVY